MKQKDHALHNKSIARIYPILPYVIIIIAALWAYSNSFNCEFQFDDIANITDQSIIKDLKNFTDPNLWTNINFRPLSMFSFAINYHLDQLDVAGFHIFNLIIHIICGFLVFLLLKKILSIYLLSKESNSTITWLSLFIALIFALHPIQTQSVTYIVQRMTALAGLFYLLAVYLYLIGRTKHSQKGFSSSVIVLYLSVLISAILSLMSKQIAVTLPLSLLLVEICFIRNKKGKVYKKFILISLSILILSFLVVTISGNLPRETKQISRLNYLITQFRIMTKYVQLSILPINQNLDHDVRSSITFWHFNEIASFLLISFLIFLSIILYKKEKLITLGIGWFFITLMLESTIIPISGMMYEHRLYLAVMGFSVCLVAIIYRLLLKRKKLMIITLILIVIVYGFSTFQRNKVWKNRFTLWSDVIKKSPLKPRPYYNMGNIMSDAAHHKTAIKYYTTAIKLDPDNVDAIVNLGNSWNSMGNTDKAIIYYEKALEYDPKYTKALNNIGIILSDRGELERAKEYYEKVLQLKPDSAEVINNLGIVWARKEEYSRAMECFQRALDLQPNYENAKKNLEIVEKFMNLNK